MDAELRAPPIRGLLCAALVLLGCHARPPLEPEELEVEAERVRAVVEARIDALKAADQLRGSVELICGPQCRERRGEPRCGPDWDCVIAVYHRPLHGDHPSTNLDWATHRVELERGVALAEFPLAACTAPASRCEMATTQHTILSRAAAECEPLAQAKRLDASASLVVDDEGARFEWRVWGEGSKAQARYDAASGSLLCCADAPAGCAR